MSSEADFDIEIPPEMLARAEAALAALSATYATTASQDVEFLRAELMRIRAAAPDGSWDTFLRRVHDIKGLGGAFGQPGLSQQAGALWAMITEAPPGSDLLDRVEDAVDKMAAALPSADHPA